MARSPFFLDKVAAHDACEFFPKYLQHTKGVLAGQPFNLAVWQKRDIIGPLFGWKSRATGLRRFNTAYILTGKKNGKSTLAAGVGLKLTCSDGEPGAEVYSCAADKEQAKIIFEIACMMIKTSPLLHNVCDIYRNEIVYTPKSGIPNIYRVISAEAYTKHGKNPSGVIFDELHAQKTRELWDVMTGSSGARLQPIFFAITNSGTDRASICYEQHEYAVKLLKKQIKDDSFLPVIYAADPKADFMDRKQWYKANPNLGVEGGIPLSDMKQKARKAQHSLSYRNTFRRFYLSIWTSAESAWIDAERWNNASTGYDIRKLKGQPCIGGLDLASKLDFNAFILLFPPHGHRKKFAVFAYFWIPSDDMEERVRKSGVPIDVWVEEGYVSAISGSRINEEVLYQDIMKWAEIFDIKELGFDQWQAYNLAQRLEDSGLKVIEVPQTFKYLSEPMKELEAMILNKPPMIEHFRNPVLAWMAQNVICSQDAHENIKPDKKKSDNKIDGIVALIIALSIQMRQEPEKVSKYERGGLDS